MDSIIVFKCKPGKNSQQFQNILLCVIKHNGKKKHLRLQLYCSQYFLKIYAPTCKFEGKDMFYQLKIV